MNANSSDENNSESEVEAASSENNESGSESDPGVSKEDDENATDCFDLLKNDESVSFKSLGVVDVLCQSCASLGWKIPSRIQQEAIPLALQGKDVIGLAETGSGKTGAFCLPILQSLLENPHGIFALVLTPTRELAFQIEEQFKALGTIIGIKSCVVVGGVDMMGQSILLAKKPHIIVATPGRLVDHLRKTKGFSLRTIEYLVLDEADRILNMDFEVDLGEILKVIPRKRRTFLFSATMTGKVQKLQRAALTDPVKCAVNSKYHTVDKLLQYYLFIPAKDKESYLVSVVNELSGNAMIIFCTTCINVQRTTIMLRNLGVTAVPLHGQMRQEKRLGALNQFKAAKMAVLVATDVASRGLDIPHVDVVLNLDVPTRSKDYIHRVGRTARAGRYGKAITFVTQYDVELYQRIEELIGKKLPAYEIHQEDVKVLQERVAEASRQARTQIREQMEMIEMKYGKRRRGDLGDLDDTEEIAAYGRKTKGIFNKKFSKKKNMSSSGAKRKRH